MKASKNKTIKVAIHKFSPFVTKQGRVYSGFDIELWEEVARRLKLNFVYKEVSLEQIFKGLKEQVIDVALAGLTITADRIKQVDFSQPYYESGLLILISAKRPTGLRRYLRFNFKKAVKWLLYFLVFVVTTGHIFWLAEKGAIVSQQYLAGISRSLWFVIVTMTTVGYGDTVPEGLLGRAVAVLLMLTGISLFGVMTANLASGIIVKRLRSDISGYSDLQGKTVGTKRGSTGLAALTDIGARIVATQNIEEAYKKLTRREIEAVVFDAPNILHYANSQGKDRVRVVGETFSKQHYGIALTDESPLRRNIDKVLLALQADGTYERIYKKWFG